MRPGLNILKMVLCHVVQDEQINLFTLLYTIVFQFLLHSLAANSSGKRNWKTAGECKLQWHKKLEHNAKLTVHSFFGSHEPPVSARILAFTWACCEWQGLGTLGQQRCCFWQTHHFATMHTSTFAGGPLHFELRCVGHSVQIAAPASHTVRPGNPNVSTRATAKYNNIIRSLLSHLCTMKDTHRDDVADSEEAH